MKLIRITKSLFPLPVALAVAATISGGTLDLAIAGCNSKPSETQQQPGTVAGSAAPGQAAPNSSMAPAQQPASAMQQQAAPPPQPVVYTIPAGTRISVSMGETISSKTASEGQPFSATVARPVVVGGKVIIKQGASASGTVVATKSRGRFKGEGFLELSLDAVHAEGRNYPVSTENVERVEKGKGKRTAGFVGGGGGFGALIGGIAGGGKGALIGGLAGAGAGTAGTAFTDNKPITIPAETVLTFRLDKAVTVR